MKLWKIMLAMLVAVLMISAVAMADDCAHNIVEIGRVPTNTYYQVPGDNEHEHVFNITYGCNKCNSTATYYTIPVEVSEYCVCNIKGETVKATCTEGEYTVYRCVCGASEKDYSEVWGALGHDWNWNKVIDKGNCQTQKKVAKVCKVCNTQEGPAVDGGLGDHVWSISQLDPTCTVDGLKYMTCTVKNCGVEKIEVIKADGTHRWDYANATVVAPTCDKVGYSTAKCMDCGTVSEQFNFVGWLNHDYIYHAAVEAKCNQVGNDAYWTCSRCPKIFKGSDANVELNAIPTIPVNTTAHEVKEMTWDYHFTSCTANTNYRQGVCIICNKTVKESIPAGQHNFYAASKLAGLDEGDTKFGYVQKASNCTKDGYGYTYCSVCGNQDNYVTIPATGHKMANTWSYSAPATCTTDMYAYRSCQHGCGATEYEIITPALGHNWKTIEGSTTATCDKAGICNRICTNCGIVENGVIVPALGHDYEEKVTAATCEKDGKVVKTCKVCKDKKTEKIPAAHGATKEVAGKAPACGVAGTMDVICTVCNAKVGEKAVAALSHEYSWKATAPTPSANGKNEYVCALCGHVAETKVVKYTKYYYNNTMTSFGPMTKELVGGNDWLRVTPVDLTVDGVYTYDLIASNKYIVGTVTITVNAGTMTVSYKTKANVDVKDEELLIYASKADLATGTAVTAPVGAAINAAETFGTDTKVLVSLVLTGDYDAAGKGLVDASAAAGMIANID